ncbi:MAG TPA: hypothetical protein VGD80_10530 [Kofleriaceae bacterium]
MSCLLACGIVAACDSPADRPPDAGRPDAGWPDAGRPDAGQPDAGQPDAGQPDAGQPDAPPDAPPPIDVDHDGVPVDVDCDDNDPDVWQNLAYSFRDADGDGRTVAASGVVCSGFVLPPGYSTVAGDPDCDDGNAAVFALLVGFADRDGDGFGDGIATPFCTAGTLPAGFVPIDGDCDADDPARWVNRPYSFRDADGDGAAVPETGQVCSGDALPPGYLTTAPVGRPLDCDDGNPAISIPLTVFADGDGDGIGAGAGQPACTDGSPPPGFSLTGTDCDDLDPAVFVSLVYTAVDFDADTFTIPAMGTRCTAGTLLPPFFAAPHGNDCDDHDPALTHFAVLYPDGDHDGVGAPPRQVLCLGATTPDGLVSRGYDEDDADPHVIETDELDDLLELIVLD